MAHLYFNEDYPEVLTEFKRLCNADTSFYNLSAISDDIVANDYPVSRDLYNKYTGNLRRAVDAVFSGDDADTDLALRLKAGVTRFGAFKAFNATQDIHSKGRTGAATAADDAENVEKRYNSFQAAEYATAASRARTAKQFAEYMTADRIRLFPNLRWLPSRSVEVRPEHRIFWNRVWPKTSEFWQHNQPGNLWNCKCDMEETDDPTDIPEKLNPKYSSASPGLKDNPAVTGKIFSDDCSYIQRVKNISSATIRKDAVEAIGKMTYKDTESDVEISALADIVEFSQNIRTARILANGGEKVKLRPDYKELIDCKNPELEINGSISDAKRVESATGIPDGFIKSIRQGASAVVIDYGNGEWKINEKGEMVKIHYNPRNTAKAISDRFNDFENGTIEKCYVVYKDKYIEIGKDVFLKYPGDTKDNRIKRQLLIMNILKQLSK